MSLAAAAALGCTMVAQANSTNSIADLKSYRILRYVEVYI